MAKAYRKLVVRINGEEFGIGDYVSFSTKDGVHYLNAVIEDISFWIDGSSVIKITPNIGYGHLKEIKVSDIDD